MPRYLARQRGIFGRGLRIAGLLGWVATQGEGFTADPFGGKKGDKEDPGVCGIFSVALKGKGTLGMSPFLPSSRKNDSLDVCWRPQADLNRC